MARTLVGGDGPLPGAVAQVGHLGRERGDAVLDVVDALLHFGQAADRGEVLGAEGVGLLAEPGDLGVGPGHGVGRGGGLRPGRARGGSEERAGQDGERCERRGHGGRRGEAAHGKEAGPEAGPTRKG
ncbi:MAG: hypothetical protein FJW95_12415 [Actinobacteria bacterium]|nr:hypothetical protein [Actinomycetota bacterium]